MPQNQPFKPLSTNTQKLLVYALIGFLSHIRLYGSKQEALASSDNPKIGEDAVYLFGVPLVFEIAKQKHLPSIVKDVLLSLDEYDVMPKSYRDELLDEQISALQICANDLNSSGGDFRREIFHWIEPQA